MRDELPALIERGGENLSPADKDLLKWVGVFFRKPTPGKFVMRIRMPNGFATAAQFRVIAEMSRRIGNGVLDITTRQQIELRGFTLETVPEIWRKLRGVDLHSLQTGMDNVRNINGCALAGLTPDEVLDASPVLFELDPSSSGATAIRNSSTCRGSSTSRSRAAPPTARMPSRRTSRWCRRSRAG